MSKKIARDLNIKNIEERVFELEKNGSGGGISEVPLATDEAVGGFKTGNGFSVNEDGNLVDEKVDNYLEKNFNQSSENIPIGCNFIDENQQIKTVWGEKKNFTTGEVELSISDAKTLQVPVNSARLQLYIDGYFDDLTDNTHKVTPIYDTVNYVVDYDLTKIPDIDKFSKVGVKYNDDLYHNALEKNLQKFFIMSVQAFSINTPENMISIGAGIQNFDFRLYLDGFEEKIAFSNTDFKLRLKIAKTVVESNVVVSKEGFKLTNVKNAILTDNHSEFTTYPEQIYIMNSEKLNDIRLVTTRNTVGDQTIIETYIVIDKINISEKEFIYKFIDIYCDSTYEKYLDMNS